MTPAAAEASGVGPTTVNRNEAEPSATTPSAPAASGGNAAVNRETPGAGPSTAARSAQPPVESCESMYKRITREVDAKIRSALSENRGQIDELLDLFTAVNEEVHNNASRLAEFRSVLPEESFSETLRELRRDVNSLMEAQTRYWGIPSTGKAPASVEERFARVSQRLSALEARVGEEAEIGEEEAERRNFEEEEDPLPTVEGQKKEKKKKSRSEKSRQEKSRKSAKSSRRKSKRKTKRRDSPSSDGSSSSSSESETESENSETQSSIDDNSGSSGSESSGDETARHSQRSRPRNRSSRSRRPPGISRSKGPRHEDPDFKEIRPSDPLYKKLLSYRYYRLNRLSSRRTGRETGKTRDHIRRMEITLRDHSFSGEDPIKVLEFLAAFRDEANTLEMTEAQAYVVLPYLLRGPAKEQFVAVKGSVAGDGGVTNWPEAVQYLLRSYATNGAIRQATLALRDTKQREGETETQYDTRLNRAFHRCGNVHSREDRISYFVDGLLPAIKDLVARHREAHARCSYLELVSYAKAEGEAYRSRFPTRIRNVPDIRIRPVGSKRTSATPRENAMLAQSSADSGELPPSDFLYEDNVQIMGEELISAATSDLPTDTPTDQSAMEEQDSMNFVGRAVLPPRLPHESRLVRSRRPGWETRSSPRPATVATQAVRTPFPVVCYCCYGRGHTSNQCIHPWRDRRSVVINYESLTEAEKEKIPAESYLRAKADVTRFEFSLAEPAAEPRGDVTDFRTVQPKVVETHPRAMTGQNPNQGN